MLYVSYEWSARDAPCNNPFFISICNIFLKYSKTIKKSIKRIREWKWQARKKKETKIIGNQVI